MSDAPMPEMLPCPFCNFDLMSDLIEALHPTGTYLRTVEGQSEYIRHDDRQPGDTPLYTVNCPWVSGGCGAEIESRTRDEVIAAWNRRASQPEQITDAERYRIIRERADVIFDRPLWITTASGHRINVTSAARSELDRMADAAIREKRSRK